MEPENMDGIFDLPVPTGFCIVRRKGDAHRKRHRGWYGFLIHPAGRIYGPRWLWDDSRAEGAIYVWLAKRTAKGGDGG